MIIIVMFIANIVVLIVDMIILTIVLASFQIQYYSENRDLILERSNLISNIIIELLSLISSCHQDRNISTVNGNIVRQSNFL